MSPISAVQRRRKLITIMLFDHKININSRSFCLPSSSTYLLASIFHKNCKQRRITPHYAKWLILSHLMSQELRLLGCCDNVLLGETKLWRKRRKKERSRQQDCQRKRITQHSTNLIITNSLHQLRNVQQNIVLQIGT